jgi:hypothetical protein
MFVLGPRLILSVREYRAELLADRDAVIVMVPMKERVSSSGV